MGSMTDIVLDSTALTGSLVRQAETFFKNYPPEEKPVLIAAYINASATLIGATLIGSGITALVAQGDKQ